MKFSFRALTLALFSLPADCGAQKHEKDTMVSGQEQPQAGGQHLKQLSSSSVRKLAATNIEVVFPNPCVTQPLDRAGNGWSNLDRNDDGSTSNVAIPFTFSLYGTLYTSIWINNNGNISFDGPKARYNPNGFPNAYDVMVAAWWTDIDTRGASSGTVWYKAIGSNSFAVVWDRVGAFPFIDTGPNTFQIMISDGTNQAMGLENNICLCYVDVGSISSSFATAGANRGNGIDYNQVGLFDHPGTDYDGSFGNNDGWDYLDNQSFCLALKK